MTPPATFDAGIQVAARHLAEGRPAEAVGVLERIVTDVPAYVTAHVLLAKAYEADGRALDALDAWHHAYFLLPGSPLIVRERTRLLRTAPVLEETREEIQSSAAEPAALPERRPESETAAEREVDIRAEGGGEEAASVIEPEALFVSAPPEPDDADTPAAVADSEEVDPEEESSEEEARGTARDASLLGEVDDLDTLIHQLENAPRIRPDASFKAERPEEEDDDEGLVSETLAKIYVAQKQYGAAARAYDQLAELHPDRAAEFEAEAAAMRRREAEGKA